METTTTLQITEEDEKWLRVGVIKALIEHHGYKKQEAIQVFDDSQLLDMLHNEPEDIFHHGVVYWANFLVKLLKWKPFEEHTCGDYDSKADPEFQDMARSYANLPNKEPLNYKEELHKDMVEDGIIEKKDKP